jgi:hypothetical protein
MALRDWLNFESAEGATAISATTATTQPKTGPNVASVARIAVATPRNEKNEPDTWGLPVACPMLDQPVPEECRFEPKFFARMYDSGVLLPGGPCPLRKVCKL